MALTIKELFAECEKQIKMGNGNKEVLISCDDEGNGFHGLFYGFTDNEENIKEYADYGLFHDNDEPKKVVLLG